MMKKLREAISRAIWNTNWNTNFEQLEWFTVKDQGRILVQTVSDNRKSTQDRMSHSWWIENAQKASIVKLKLVEKKDE